MYHCPFFNRCSCDVKFRVVTTESDVFLYTHGKHTEDSHSSENTARQESRPRLTLQQQAAVQDVVRSHPMSSSSDVRRSLNLSDSSARDRVYISPSKARLIRRESAKVREAVLSKYTHGERIDKTEGSLTRMCEKIYIEKLVAEHNRPGGKHLDLHEPLCVGYQFEKGVSFGCFSSAFMLLNTARAVNSEWPLHLGFDATGSMSDTKFDIIGVTTNSLRTRANPVCLAMVNKECADGYEHTYEAMEAGVFQIVAKLKTCSEPDCEMCNAVREQVEQAPMRAELTPPKPRAKGQPVPKKKFKLPLQNPLCDNTTKFSKFILKKHPHLRRKILQCAAHLTGTSLLNEFLLNYSA